MPRIGYAFHAVLVVHRKYSCAIQSGLAHCPVYGNNFVFVPNRSMVKALVLSIDERHG
jgi:hypothetical protein